MNLTTGIDQVERSLGSFDLRRALSSRVDLLLGAVLAVLALLGTAGATSAPLDLAGVLLATVPHVMRRAYPWLTVTLTLVGAALIVMSPPRPGAWAIPVIASAALSFYTVQRLLERRAAWIFTGGIGALLTGVAVLAYLASGPIRLSLVAVVCTVVGALVVGITMVADVRRSRTEIKEVRADNLETLREQAAMAERARIAREMHDVVAHSISMVAVQAETAPYTIKDLNDEARREFAEIATAARGTLTEMRRLLGVLRADVPPETAPQPGLRQLPELLEHHGGEVDLDIVGEEKELPQAVDMSAYRIIQESLTNARTHAPGARVSIEIAYRPTLLALRIADDGPGPAAPENTQAGPGEGPGHGLIGMRERAVALGGWFVAGPGPAGGFLVQAGLPLE
ncbi:sensor histidine kinase [Planotetraspora kaengkrachanensis]|uniref:histidine kinase n=1 Tax=Planotetraspora kaengkrachanensis TaxID=575193 RepID=A0A8J3PV81_9ACTN|nr:histidine kinase [Planotetraspora kaengkrachanensis]GIG81675.1 two-component sensor histidine kinase [Planotetraspora kaengkrachanensis]